MASQNRKSFLTYEPISFSLTEGTNIPPPPPVRDTPPTTSNGVKSKLQTPAQSNGDARRENGITTHGRADSLRSPDSPSAFSKTATPRQQGVRRLFSLNSLRSSFSSSRASLALPDDEGVKRPLSPSAPSTTTASPQQARPQSRASRKGNSWFKRKTETWSANGDNGLASIGEDGRPTTRENKRIRERSPAPLLPEINKLAGGSLNNGEVEWDEKLFKK